MGHLCNGILLGHKKKRKILPIVTVWMDTENIMLSKISQTEKNKYHMISLTCGINEETELTRKMRQTQREREQDDS